MHLGIDLHPLQLDSYRDRGIGTHLRHWIEAAQALPTSLTVSLIYNKHLPTPQLTLTAPNWQLVPLELPPSLAKATPDTQHNDPDDEFLYDSVLESFLLAQRIDVFHATHMLMSEAFSARRVFNTPWVASIYDLIPLLFHQEYLAPLGERAKRSFAQRLGATVYAQRIQTISQSAKAEIQRATGLPAARIDVIYGGVDDVFKPLETSSLVQKQLGKLGITEPYIFSVSGVHHTKNLNGLLQAYAQLSPPLLQKYHLVVLLPLSPTTQRAITAKIEALNLQNQITLLNHVDQDELVALYNGATLVTHPTLFEGLGLPILEAMRCGTPVVCSNTSSMPEIAGDAAQLVDPQNPAAIAQAMQAVLESPDLQSTMIEKGLHQAAQFTWTRTAQIILDSYDQVNKTAFNGLGRRFLSKQSNREPQAEKATRQPKKNKLRLAFWSPLNPRPSGISDYSEALIAELGKLADLDLYVDGYQPNNLPLFDTFPCYDASAYRQIAQAQPYDMNIYQVGNNPLHSYLYRQILAEPGLVTLHDYCLFHMLHKYFVGRGDFEGLWQEVAYCEKIDHIATVKRDYFTQSLDEYTLPLNRRIVEASQGVVVHSQSSCARLQEYAAVPPVQVIPMGTLLLPDDQGRFGRRIRRMLGLPEQGFIFALFGNVHPAKRITAILNTFAKVREKYPNATLFIMGAVSVSALEIMRPFRQNIQAAREQGIYLHLMYARFDLMLMAMQAIDVGLNLRYPTAGETSSTLSFLLGQGKPTIVSDVGSFAEYPDRCCPKVPVDDNEEAILFQHMVNLIEHHQTYQQAQQAAFDFSQNKTWPHIAQMYLSFVETLLKK